MRTIGATKINHQSLAALKGVNEEGNAGPRRYTRGWQSVFTTGELYRRRSDPPFHMDMGTP